MKIKKTEKGFILANDASDENAAPYIVKIGENGKKYVARNSVAACYLNVSDGNSKTGPAVNFNMPIEYTCNHACECYKKGVCYAETGCYTFSSNQQKYSENLNFFLANDDNVFVQAIQFAIEQYGYKLFRWFTCGDILNSRFFRCMVKVAENNPGIEFWAYTKKYNIVNKYIDENGALPANLAIIFSHWTNNDGSYYPMDNPHNLPTSEFIPFGRENMITESYHVCPCSDPTVKATCATCEKPCYRLKAGEHMALLEHSTSATKARDKELKAAKAAL